MHAVFVHTYRAMNTLHGHTLSEFPLCLLTGQFWNITLKIVPYVGEHGERLVDLMDRFYSVTVSNPNAPERTFVAQYDVRLV